MIAPAKAAPSANSRRTTLYLPREHGATAMLLTPIFSVAILARAWHWSELAVLAAALAAISAKDPAVVVTRQQFVWKQLHPETPVAIAWLIGWSVILVSSSVVLLAAWPLKAFLGMSLGIAAFAAVAILVNVKNRQRSTLFQIVSAAALTSTSLATCMSATGSIPSWCWWFWLLITLQASGGILVVHARLDARIALRGKVMGAHFRRAAQVTLGVLACAAITAVTLHHVSIALALILAASAYGYDLVRQRDSAALQLPLKTVGQRAFMLSTLYSALLIAGLW
jgi:YwiC-like protein